MQGATVAWADGYDLFSLEAWAPAAAGDAFAAEVGRARAAGSLPKGTIAARIDEAVERAGAWRCRNFPGTRCVFSWQSA